MYATVRSYSGSPGLVDALVEHEADVKNLLTDIGGFRSYHMIRTGDDSAVSVTVYDDRSGAEESNKAAAQWIGENLGDLSIAKPQVSAGEVALTF